MAVEPDTHPRTFRLYDREAGFTLAMMATFGLVLAFGPLDAPLLLVVWALGVNGLLVVAQLGLGWRRGGTVTIDPVARELRWTRPPAGEPSGVWSFDEIARLDTPRKGCTNVVRLDVGSRKLLLAVPADRAGAVADWLGQTVRPSAIQPAAEPVRAPAGPATA